jgi:undecaprenyl-diphosphatase
MLFYHIIILALVQGITEFLPVSSSGHLVLAHEFINGGEAGDRWGADLTMDVAVHVGTLFSVLLYFRKDIAKIFCGAFKAAKGNSDSNDLRLGISVLIASAPVIAAGLTLEVLEPQFLRSPAVIAWTTLLFGILLWVADRFFPAEKQLENLTYTNALWVGLAQVLALVPGVSRSGITMTAGRFLGFSRTESARFSLLLAIIAISGAGTLQVFELIASRNLALGMDVLLAMVLAFFSGLAAISLMMRWLSKATFTPFAIYRVVLGGLLVILLI